MTGPWAPRCEYPAALNYRGTTHAETREQSAGRAARPILIHAIVDGL
jgi:hypothetical protein